jgi:DNA-binding GntR family transcriptional regulator
MTKPASRVVVPGQAADSLVDLACQKLRQRILDNEWPPGARALEQELALELGMSRTPVREALIRLSNEGLVEVVPRHGVRVLPVSAADMDEIYRVIGSLEATAAEIIAERRPKAAELKPLEDATRAMDVALKADDLAAWAAADEVFHRTLVELAGNRLLAGIVYNFWDRAHRARMFTQRLRAKPVNSTQDHLELVRALKRGDKQAARELHLAHRERARIELTAILARYLPPHL